MSLPSLRPQACRPPTRSTSLQPRQPPGSAVCHQQLRQQFPRPPPGSAVRHQQLREQSHCHYLQWNRHLPHLPHPVHCPRPLKPAIGCKLYWRRQRSSHSPTPATASCQSQPPSCHHRRHPALTCSPCEGQTPWARQWCSQQLHHHRSLSHRIWRQLQFPPRKASSLLVCLPWRSPSSCSCQPEARPPAPCRPELPALCFPSTRGAISLSASIA